MLYLFLFGRPPLATSLICSTQVGSYIAVGPEYPIGFIPFLESRILAVLGFMPSISPISLTFNPFTLLLSAVYKKYKEFVENVQQVIDLICINSVTYIKEIIMTKQIDLTGQKYGKLTLLEKIGMYYLCLCDCGKTKKIRVDHLIRGETVSCGCYGKKRLKEAWESRITHGMSNTRIFKIWIGMLDRCKNDRSGNYGKRGIKVCDRWKEFIKFYNDMGEPPDDNYSIDRINVDGNYEPGNCRWADRKTQGRNKRNSTLLTYNGETKTLAEWSEIKSIKPATLCYRLYNLGWSAEKALETKVVPGITTPMSLSMSL
jgi:hypothetical protein